MHMMPGQAGTFVKALWVVSRPGPSIRFAGTMPVCSKGQHAGSTATAQLHPDIRLNLATGDVIV